MKTDHWREAYDLHEMEWTGYDHLYSDFEWEVPDQFNIAQSTSEYWAGSDRLALIAVDEDGADQRYTFAEVDRAANQLANAFVADGIDSGDRIAVTGRQRPAVTMAHLAAWKCGAITVPISPIVGTDGLAYRLQDTDATAAVIGSSLSETLADCDRSATALTTVYTLADTPHLEDAQSIHARRTEASGSFETVSTAADKPASIFYTSGSTGDPKGVVLPHRTLLGMLPSYLTLKGNLELFETDRFWTPSEWAWIALYTTVFTTWFYGIPVLAYDRGPFDAAAVWRFIDQYEVTSMSIPPAALRRLRDASDHGSGESVRVVLTGGSLVRESTAKWVRHAFDPVSLHISYGLTEAAIIIGNCDTLERPYQAGTIGVAQPGHEIRLIAPNAEDCDPVPDGEVGEIAIRADADPVCLDRYWDNPAATEKAFREGWLLTNDLGQRTDTGYIEYVGRADDVIISAGYRIGPVEIEEQLDNHEAVAAVGVVGVPDDERGEIPKAVVVLTERYTGGEKLRETLQDYVKETLAMYKYPREIEFTDELPRTSTGKLKRDELRE